MDMILYVACVLSRLQNAVSSGTAFFHKAAFTNLHHSPPVLLPFPEHPSPAELSQHRVLLAADAIILLFPPTSMASVVKNTLGVPQATLHIHHILPLRRQD